MTVTTIGSGTTVSAGYTITAAGVTLVNDGSLGALAAPFGVELKASGVVTNQSGGTITGSRDGVDAATGVLSTIVNYGRIDGTAFGVELAGGGSVVNQAATGTIIGGGGAKLYGTNPALTNAGYVLGTSGFGAYLKSAGSVTNLSTGTIAGATFGVTAAAAMTLENAGTIKGAGGTAVGFHMGAAGLLKLDPGASFTGIVDGGNPAGAVVSSTLELDSNASIGTIAGFGSQYIDFAQATVDAGAAWLLNGLNTIVSGMTLTNSGSLTVGGSLSVAGSLINSGVVNGYVSIAAGGALSNLATGLISAAGTGVAESGTSATVTNAGQIEGSIAGVAMLPGLASSPGQLNNLAGGKISGDFGVLMSGGNGTLVNGGSISGTLAGTTLFPKGAIDLTGLDVITNQSGGVISGAWDGVYSILGAAVPRYAFTNAGSIGGAQDGMQLSKGFNVTNQTGGVISGASYGVIMGIHGGRLVLKDGVAGTVVNAGQITGANGTAVYFTSGYASRMILLPGASFSGIVNGGNTIGYSIVSTLELTRGYGTTGTLSNLGSRYINFAQVSVDAGANWALAGNNPLTGVTLTDSGALTNIGSITLGGTTGLNGGLGFYVAGGGRFTNSAIGEITTPIDAVDVLSTTTEAGTAVNAGSITNTAGFAPGAKNAGVKLETGGALTNQSGGVISGSAYGVYAAAGGLNAAATIVNQSGGTVQGNIGIGSITQTDQPTTVINSGRINGIDMVASGGSTFVGRAVILAAGGTVTNLAGGIISGEIGLEFTGGDATATVVNAGDIAAIGGAAVQFSAGPTNRLVIDPGAVFGGQVNGANPIGAAAVSTLELAAGSSGGTLNGLGVQYMNFAQILVDVGASWNLTGASTLASGATLTDQGALLLTGSTVTGGGAVTIDSTTGVAGSLTVAGGGVWSGDSGFVVGGTGAGQLLIDAAGTISASGVDVAQSAGSSGTITVTGTKSLLTNSGSFAVGFAGLGVLTIEGGGTVQTSAGLIVATEASASGSSVNVSGAGSSLQVGGTVVVGAFGFGSLSLSRGATVTAGAMAVGVAGGAGDVALAGTGTTLDITSALTLGDGAAGELDILGGARMTVDGGFVGSGDSAPGNLDVEGNGSQLTINTGTLVVGANGPAEFTLGIGATLQGEVANGQFGVVNEYGNVDPPTDPNDGTQNVGFGNSLIYDFYVANSGTIKITSGTATFYSPLVTDETNAADGSSNGLWVIGAHDTLVMNATSVDQTQTFDFTSPSAASLVIGQVPQASTTEFDTFNGQTMPSLTGSIAPGAANVLPGWNAPIENYQNGDVIVLQGLTYRSATASGDAVTVWSGAGGTGTPLGSLTFVTKSDAPSSTEAAAAASQINALACFAAGTRIETVSGPVAVEDLRVGDEVRTVLEGSGRVVWVGSRKVDPTRHPRPETVWPVRIRAGAFGFGIPGRDLWLSPDHAVYVGTVLIPIKYLINGTSVAQIRVPNVEYFHVELPEHDVLLAEGLPAESYLDIGDRANFTNGTGPVRLFPTFAARVWDALGCAPLRMVGPDVAAARRMLASRISSSPAGRRAVIG